MNVGTATVKITPDTSTIRAAVAAELRRMADEIEHGDEQEQAA